MTSLTISNITIYPIKSLDGISVDEASIVLGGALQHDREFALHDLDGRWVNGKRDARLNTIRSEYDLSNLTVKLSAPSHPNWKIFHLIEDKEEIENWFGSLLGLPVEFRREPNSGFPDDLYAKGPTVISTGTINELNSWFENLGQDETRRRFRANIEISSGVPFWEDQLYGRRNHDIGFRIGEVEIFGVGPCKRCVVPTRDSMTGDVTTDFSKTFIAKRESTFPAWANRARFGPLLYRVAINTRINDSEVGKRIKVGETFQLSETTSLT